MANGKSRIFLAAGWRYSFAINNGRLFSWGEHRSLQAVYSPEEGISLSANPLDPRPSPAALDANFDWEAVSLGGVHILAVRNGMVFAWGRNNYCQLGTGDLADRETPAVVVFPKAL